MGAPGTEGGTAVGPDEARELALAAGFTEAGLVALPYAAEARDAERFAAWVRSGRAGTMQYLERTGEDGRLTRERVGVPFPWARSALVCFSSYLSPSAPLSIAGCLTFTRISARSLAQRRLGPFSQMIGLLLLSRPSCSPWRF